MTLMFVMYFFAHCVCVHVLVLARTFMQKANITVIVTQCATSTHLACALEQLRKKTERATAHCWRFLS